MNAVSLTNGGKFAPNIFSSVSFSFKMLILSKKSLLVIKHISLYNVCRISLEIRHVAIICEVKS